jgi:hypothetical protein
MYSSPELFYAAPGWIAGSAHVRALQQQSIALLLVVMATSIGIFELALTRNLRGRASARPA